MKNITNKLNSILFGISIFSPLRQRIFISMVFISIIVTIIGNIINILLGLPLFIIAITFDVTVIFIIIFYRLRKSSKVFLDFYYYVFWVIVFVATAYLWFLNAGIDSNFTILFGMGYIGLFLTTKPENRFAVLIFSSLFIAILILMDFYFPELIVRYENKAQRITDLVIGIIVYLSVIHYFLNTVWQQSNFEQSKLKIKNIQLDNLSKERKELNERLELSVKEMEYANTAKDSFISIISHDLRSPFQGLLGVSRLLNENYNDLNDDEKKQLIQKLNNLLENQYSFLEELLLWGLLQRSSVNLKVDNINLKEILLSEISHFSQAIDQKKLNVKLLDTTDVEIKTDRNLISTVFRNILSNAIKFSPIGQKIEVFVKCEGNTCLVNIKDYGEGISEEDLPYLFRLDTKVSRKGTDGETGTGFGLVLCSDIMMKLNGKILIESKEGSGTTVTIVIPQANL